MFHMVPLPIAFGDREDLKREMLDTKKTPVSAFAAGAIRIINFVVYVLFSCLSSQSTRRIVSSSVATPRPKRRKLMRLWAVRPFGCSVIHCSTLGPSLLR